MIYNLIVLPHAANDVIKAYLYYFGIRKLLSDEFLEEVKNIYKKLEINPQFYCFINSKKKSNFRYRIK